MTRKQMITACVEDQIKRGLVNEAHKVRQIKARLNGAFKMSYTECEKWYNEVFGK